MTATLSLTGSFTLDAIPRIEREAAGQLDADGVTIDLSAITEVDSTAVSLLLQWQREASAKGRKLTLLAPPASLVSLAKLYGVEDFLAFS
jgi:phospholipid transport system transporter-binding protein